MGKWGRYTGYKKRNAYISTTSLVLPRVVYETLDNEPTYPKCKIREFAETNRRHPTKAEFELHQFFKRNRGGLLKRRYKRQHPISGKWIVDFFFPEVRLAIEVDGPYHRNPAQKKKDRLKDADCEKFEITVLRIRNRDVFGDRDQLIEKLRDAWTAARNRNYKIIKPLRRKRCSSLSVMTKRQK